MSDAIVVTCDNCGKKLKSRESSVGKEGKCPGCGSIIRIVDVGGGLAKGVVEKKVDKETVETGEASMLNIARHDDVAVVTFRTSRILDQSNVQQLGEEFDSLITKFAMKKIVLNFENIHYMSSAVMGKLVSLHKQLEAGGGQMRLCCISPSIYEIFKIMRFHKLFAITDSEDKAVMDLMG